MRLTPAQLQAQIVRAHADWPWIRDVEDEHRVPSYLLYALGSRETNMRNVLQAAPGHGVGVWQRDTGAFPELRGHEQEYLADLRRQANDAATLLMSHFEYFQHIYPHVPSWNAAVCAYNAGRGGVRRKLDAGLSAESATTHGDYGPDVLNRWGYCVYWYWSLV